MERRLRAIVVAIVVASIVLGLFAGRIVDAIGSPSLRAEWLRRAGKPARVEEVWWKELHRGHADVPTIVAFLEAHEAASVERRWVTELDPRMKKALPDAKDLVSKIDDDEIDAFIHSDALPHDVAVIGRFLRGERDATLLAEIVAGAESEPPRPYMNHALADVALDEGRFADAVGFLEREGVAFGRRGDIANALSLRQHLEGDAALDARLADPAIGPLAPPQLQLERAIANRAYGRALRWAVPAGYRIPDVGALLITVIAALAWFAFVARVGQIAARPGLRVPLYLTAFALGVASIAPTVFLIEWQTAVLHLTPNGTAGHDAVFFVFGVGFREELSKLLCFLPLVPILRARGNRLDVIACGALVGLGFAAAENLDYLAGSAASIALARFLTANFLHMSMTGIAAIATYGLFDRDKGKRKEDDGFYRFTVAFLTVVVLHGVYDFFLEGTVFDDGGFLAMGVLFYLMRRFILEIHDARLVVGRSGPLLPIFAVGMASVTGASFVYVASFLGAGGAFDVMFLGLLGSAILVIMFVAQLRYL